MWEELAFKDFKSSGWQWQRSRVWDPEHSNRLWLVMALAYVWVLSLGTQVAHSPYLQAHLSRGKKRRHSFFQLALRFLRRWIQIGYRLAYDFLLIPKEPPLMKSVV